MKCAVCGIELPERTVICRFCGFDISACVELYPTFVRNVGVQKTLTQRKREAQVRLLAQQAEKLQTGRTDASTASSSKEHPRPLPKGSLANKTTENTVKYSLDAFASPAFSIGDLFFQIEGQKLIRYLGKDYHVIIPDGITEIGARAFADNRDLQHIELPKSVTKIGENAFSNCSNLTGLVLPEGVQSIGKGAFSGSGIEMLKIPDGVRIIHERLCENCTNLFAVVLPKHVTKVEPFAFSGCNQIVSVFDPVILMNFRNVQVSEGNECLMRGVLKSIKTIDTYLFAISLNLGMINLSSYTPYYFLCDADDAFAEKLTRASKAYIGNLAPDERPILLFDDSMFGSGKSGFVITTRRIYYKQLWDKRSYPLSQLIGFARQEDRFGFAVKNGESPFLPFFSKAKSADAAQKIIEALDAACNWLKILNEPT